MLPRRYRLTKSADIKQVLRAPRARQTKDLRVHILCTSKYPHPRLAVIVSKRVHASSYVRHRYQRKLRAAAKEIFERFGTGCDIVIVAKPSIVATKKQVDLKAQLEQVLK